MNKSLYETLDMKRKNSTLKSVFVTKDIFEGCIIINVEAYDTTGYNAINTTVSKFDKFYDYLNKTILENFETVNNITDMVRVCVYGIYRTEYILTMDGKVF